MPLSAKLTKEIAAAELDPKYILFDNVPELPDDTLRFLLGSDFEKYDLILKDAKAKALLEVRDRNVTCREWKVEPASSSRKDKKAADVVKEVLLGCDFDQISSDLNSNSVLKGNAFVELKWGIDGKTTYIEDAVAKPNHRFRFVLNKENAKNIAVYKGYQIRVLSQGNFYLGDQIPVKRILCHAYGRRTDNPWGIGLGRVLYWMAVIFKKEIWKQRLIYLDQYAEPAKVGTPPDDGSPNRSTKGQRDEFRQALKDMISGKVGVLPPGWKVDLLEAARSSTNDAFQNAIDAINSEMAMLVLGETLSMELPGAGSRAAAQTHSESSHVYLAKFDSDRLSTGALRDLARWITELNVPDAKPPMIWRSFPELDAVEDLNQRVNRDNVLKAIGYQINPEKVKEVYGDGYIDLEEKAKQDAAEQAQQQQESGAFDIGFSESSYEARKAIAFRERMQSGLLLPKPKQLILPEG
jgi:phage gp29-like protein